MAHVSVSYSRRDSDFVLRLRRLDRGTRKVGLAGHRGDRRWGAEFPEALRRAIEESDAIVSVITPASVESPYCEQEIEHAQMLGKRILPVLRTQVPDEALHEEVRDCNWIPFDADDRLNGPLDRSLRSIPTAHTYRATPAGWSRRSIGTHTSVTRASCCAVVSSLRQSRGRPG